MLLLFMVVPALIIAEKRLEQLYFTRAPDILKVRTYDSKGVAETSVTLKNIETGEEYTRNTVNGVAEFDMKTLGIEDLNEGDPKKQNFETITEQVNLNEFSEETGTLDYQLNYSEKSFAIGGTFLGGLRAELYELSCTSPLSNNTRSPTAKCPSRPSLRGWTSGNRDRSTTSSS